MKSVMRYGLLPPIEGADLVREQMRLAHSYKNDLIRIARNRRTDSRKLDVSQDGDLVLKDAACQRLCTRFAEQCAADQNRLKVLVFMGAGPLPEVYAGLKQHIEVVNELESDGGASAATLAMLAKQFELLKIKFDLEQAQTLCAPFSSAETTRAFMSLMATKRREKAKEITIDEFVAALRGVR